MLIKKSYKEAIAKSGLELLQKGLTVGTWGNLSVKDPETGLIYIKPSGMQYEDITAEDVVVMDKDFRVIEGRRKPSVEFHLHISIMNARSDLLRRYSYSSHLFKRFWCAARSYSCDFRGFCTACGGQSFV